MLPLFFSAILAGAPRAHPEASVSVYLPKLERAGALTRWFGAAGARAAIFRPESWRGEMHPLLFLDLSRPESFREGGIDFSGSMTVSYGKNLRMSCTELSDPQRFEERIGQRLLSLGERWEGKAEGVSLVGARARERVVAGYAIRGKEACAVSARGGSILPALELAARLLKKPSPPAWGKRALSVPGAALMVTQEGSCGLSAEGRSLTLDGRAMLAGLPGLSGKGPSPYASMVPSGLAFLRARVAPTETAALSRMAAAPILELCPACDPRATRELAETLSAQLTGSVLLRVDSFRPRESLKSAPARFFALRHVYLAELRQPEQAKQALSALAGFPGVRETASGYSLSVRGGELLVGVEGAHLYLGNDEGAIRAALQALPAQAAEMAHGAELVVDPPRVAQGLSQVSLLDVIASQELAALFATAIEIGPLLSASERMVGWADSAGRGEHRYRATWTLKPEPPASAPSGGGR